ncbi:MAG TPA: hypothetical protein VJP40_09350 [bacterium]|nr:hypothetical protein [bacterium]
MDFLKNLLPLRQVLDYDDSMPRIRRKKFGSVLLLVWAIFFFALPALIGLCQAEAKADKGHDCCGAKVACHNQIQPQSCCETQGSAPPSASPLLSWAASLAPAVSPSAQVFPAAIPPAGSSTLLRSHRAGIFLLHHSFLC